MAVDVAELAGLALGLPLLLLVPGLSLLAALPPAKDAEARASGLVEGLWRAVIASIVVTGSMAVILADLSVYRLAWLALLVAAASLSAWLLAGRPRPHLPRPTWADVPPLGLFLFALLLFSPPHETILGAAAPGSYIASAAQVAYHGSLALVEPLVGELDAADRDLFLRSVPDAPGMPVRFPDFYIIDAEAGVSVPQFFPFHPVWLAVGMSLGGVWGALWLLPLWGALGIVGVYFAGRRAFGMAAATIGAITLALTAPQVWFSRYTVSEALTQALLWAAVYAFSVYVASGFPARLGLLAGLALGGVLLTRIDTPFVLALPVGLAAWLVARAVAQRGTLGVGKGLRAALAATWPFFVPVVALTGLTAVHTAVFSRPYIQSTSQVLPFVIPLVGIGSLGGGGVALALWLAWRWAARGEGQLARLLVALARPALALGILAVAGWAYFVRPSLGQPLTWTNWYSGAVTAYPHLSLVHLGWYLSPLGIALAAVGAAWAGYRGPTRRVWLVLALGLFFAVLYLANPLNSPRHIYMMRRYVPAVLPAFSLFAGYALAGLARLPRPGQPRGDAGHATWLLARRVATGMLAVALLAGLLPQTLAVRAKSETAGAVAQVARLAEGIDPAGVVVFLDAELMGLASQVGMPLQFLHGRDALLVMGEEGPERLTRLIYDWQAQGRPVYVAVSGGGQPVALDVGLMPAAVVGMEFPTLEAPFDHPPRAWNIYRPTVEVYRVVTDGEASRLDVGGPDALGVRGGLYDRETTGAESFRWTDGDAWLRLPALTGAAALRLRLAGQTPGPTPVEVWLDGQMVGQLDAAPGFAEYRLPIPSGVASGRVVEVRLISPTFSPGGSDPRRLGILVDWLAFE